MNDQEQPIEDAGADPSGEAGTGATDDQGAQNAASVAGVIAAYLARRDDFATADVTDQGDGSAVIEVVTQAGEHFDVGVTPA